MAVTVAVTLSLAVCAAAPVISVASMLMCRTMLARDYQVGIHETRINQVRSGLFLVDDLRYDCGYDWGCLAFYDDLRRMVLMTVMTAVPVVTLFRRMHWCCTGGGKGSWSSRRVEWS
jgi:hypothetical protein